jgi:hydrogenase-4 component E
MLIQYDIYVQRIILLFAISSFVVTAFLVLLGLNEPSGRYILFILAGLTMAVRGLAIPIIMRHALHSLHKKPWRVREEKPIMGIGGSVLISLVLIIIGFFIYKNSLVDVLQSRSGAVPFVLFLQAFLIVISRRHAYIQLIGYLVMENAVVILSGWVFSGLPFIVEAGVILDLLALVVVSSLIIRTREKSIILGGNNYESTLKG